MRIIFGEAAAAGSSKIELDRYEDMALVERTEGVGARLLLVQEVESYRQLCIDAQREEIFHDLDPETDSGTRREIAARQVRCCMQWSAEYNPLTDGETLSVVTEPGCRGCGETIPNPDQFVIVGTSGQLAIAMSDVFF